MCTKNYKSIFHLQIKCNITLAESLTVTPLYPDHRGFMGYRVHGGNPRGVIKGHFFEISLDKGR